MKRAIVALGGAFAAIVCAAPALADAPPLFAALPSARLPDAPTVTAPARVDSGASVDDLVLRYVVAPQNRRPVHRGDMKSKGFFAPPLPSVTFRADSETRCFTTLDGPNVAAAPVSFLSTAPEAHVFGVRSERLRATASGATLEITDLWIDPQTLHARPFASVEIPLARIAAGPHGFAVYGFRHGDFVEVVIPKGDGLQTTTKESLAANCGHQRVALEGGGGGSAAFFSTSFTSAVPPTWTIHVAPVTPRTWAINGNVSVSRSSSDREPLLAVTLQTTVTEVDGP